jgi:hypothetical protein
MNAHERSAGASRTGAAHETERRSEHDAETGADDGHARRDGAHHGERPPRRELVVRACRAAARFRVLVLAVGEDARRDRAGGRGAADPEATTAGVRSGAVFAPAAAGPGFGVGFAGSGGGATGAGAGATGAASLARFSRFCSRRRVVSACSPFGSSSRYRRRAASAPSTLLRRTSTVSPRAYDSLAAIDRGGLLPRNSGFPPTGEI